MVAMLARDWWALALRGLLAIVFGLIAWVWPGLTMAVLVLLFGLYAFSDGIFTLITAIRARHTMHSYWVFILEGVLGIVAGLVVFFSPAVGALALYFLVAGWALATGVLEIYAAIRLRKVLRDEIWLGLTGVVSIALGVLMLLQPAAGLLAVVWMIGSYAIVFGALMMAFAFRMRSLRSQSPIDNFQDHAPPHPPLGGAASHAPA
jgi:uncharacterized membrane protein HdeD (DUF308 family)